MNQMAPLLITLILTATACTTGAAPTTVTIRQLMPLRDAEVDAYEQDDLLEGLPEVEP